MVHTFRYFVLLLLLLVDVSFAIDNGLGLTPSMGWRSWNQFQCDGFPSLNKEFNQNLIMKMIDAVVDKSRTVKGVPTSLLEIGYNHVGLDDCWQLCDSGPGGQGWHDINGNPIVNKSRFPDFKGLTSYAHQKGVYAGWYMNNCHCKSSCSSELCFKGDSNAVAAYGFDSVKLDGCSAEKNVTHWAELLNKTGRPILIENCHNGPNTPDPTKTPKEQPFNFFRSSDDIRPTFGSVLSNLQTVRNWVASVGPGCWAYPDMLEVGVTNSQRPSFPTLSVTEARTHFGAWSIVSSPLILGLDLTDSQAVDSIWDIITNTEAIAINQAWTGSPGDLISESTKLISFQDCSWSDNSCQHPSWQIWGKPLKIDSTGTLTEVALLLMNNDIEAQSLQFKFSQVRIGCTTCLVRDVWAQKDLGNFTDTFTSPNLPSHDSSFLVISVPLRK